MRRRHSFVYDIYLVKWLPPFPICHNRHPRNKWLTSDKKFNDLTDSHVKPVDWDHIFQSKSKSTNKGSNE